MSRKSTFALIGLFVALTTGAALAQEEPTYEGRGYGGPLGVGPNFQQGGQWGPPIYGAGREHSSTTERYREPQRTDRVQRKRTTDDDDVKTAKKTPAPEEFEEGVEGCQGAERELEHRHHRLRITRRPRR